MCRLWQAARRLRLFNDLLLPSRPLHLTKSGPASFHRIFQFAIMGIMAGLALYSSSAMAGSSSETRLVSCGNEICLKVNGFRDDPRMIVSFNGNQVEVVGEKSWHYTLQIEAVRQMSAPAARTIEISLLNPVTRQEKTVSAKLPIGLLGNTTSLDAIVVKAL